MTLFKRNSYEKWLVHSLDMPHLLFAIDSHHEYFANVASWSYLVAGWGREGTQIEAYLAKLDMCVVGGKGKAGRLSLVPNGVRGVEWRLYTRLHAVVHKQAVRNFIKARVGLGHVVMSSNC